MRSTAISPNHPLLHTHLWSESDNSRKEPLHAVTKEIITEYVDILVRNYLNTTQMKIR